MIFVTVGLHYQGFERLIEAVDELELNEKVIAQIGPSSYIPRDIEHFREASIDEVNKYFKEARLVVSHAGIGSIITALKYGKPLIIVPRLRQYGEHNNDHQLEVAKAVEDEDKASVVYDVSALAKSIKNPRKPKPSIGRESLITSLRNYLNTLEGADER